MSMIPPKQVGSGSELIGASRGLRHVWASIQLVARTDSTVLIQGETGTGKELVAKAIHGESLRNRGPYIKLNCAAMPAGLVESQLFGHERGAFTGALTQTTGRFQQAHTGTLFLDEIGDLPLELQPKLLRVLQEQQFERLGGGRTVQVDVRVVAATNQDLWQMVQERKFRADLYYRLNVFPLTLPPLRERPEDIPMLVAHFVRRFEERQGKAIDEIPDDVMEALQRRYWPGNIRELENFIERAVILTDDGVLRPPSAEPTMQTNMQQTNMQQTNMQPGAAAVGTLADAERAHIIATLRETNWVVGGRNGAAARLGLARTTLIARMQKLGISKESPKEPGRWTSTRPPAACGETPGSLQA